MTRKRTRRQKIAETAAPISGGANGGKTMQDQFGNELGVNAEGTTTFNGRTMLDYINAGELPNGYYFDPEGAVRQLEGSLDANKQFIGTTGERGSFGGGHAIAVFENGKIVAFKNPGGIPGGFGATPAPDATTAKAKRQADVATALAEAQQAVAALAELARS